MRVGALDQNDQNEHDEQEQRDDAGADACDELAVGPGRESGMPLGRCARTRTQRMCRHCMLPDLPEQS